MFNIFNNKGLSDDEVRTLQRAERLRTVVTMPGWDDVVSILGDISQSMYPNPKDKKYDLFPWKGIEKDYTYARGGTEVVKEFLSVMSQQEEVYKNLYEKSMKVKDKEEDDEELYQGLQHSRN